MKMSTMGSKMIYVSFTLLILVNGFSSAQAAPPAKIVNGFLSNALSLVLKWVWSLKATTKTDSRPRLVAGSAEGYAGHVDGKLRKARMNNTKGLAVDDKGNIYIADMTNMAIRKISDTRITTIAGGKWSRGGGHVDGQSEDARFSKDFDVVYIGSSCSLLVIDRGNQAIREIQLHFDDCAYQYGSGLPLGIIVLVAAGFFGYMLALLQQRVKTIVSPQNVSHFTRSDSAKSSEINLLSDFYSKSSDIQIEN